MNISKGFPALIAHFKKHGWHFQVDTARSILRTGFTGRNGAFQCAATVDDSDDLLQFFSLLPVVVPAHKRQAVAELCVRLSYVMKVGNFEFDFNDGEARFHTTAPYPKGELVDDLIQRTILVNLVMTDMHFPAFMSVIYADVPPADAVRQAKLRLATPGAEEQQPELQMPSRISFN
jgi:hypothetical protein